MSYLAIVGFAIGILFWGFVVVGALAILLVKFVFKTGSARARTLRATGTAWLVCSIVSGFAIAGVQIFNPVAGLLYALPAIAVGYLMWRTLR